MDRIAARLAEVARDGRYILGPEVSAFEREFAAYLGTDHAVGVGNGTDALTIALRAVGVQAGDEVVCPSLTFYASAESIVNAGARPVFCDVDPDTLCVTPDSVCPHLTDRTRAIVAVHLFGNVAPVADLRELGLPVVEDAAQAAGARLHGARAGALGDAGTFSFFPSKNLPCLGDGGAITTSSDEVAERARSLRFHGSSDKKTHTEVGYNSRLDSLQAAVLRLLLPELDGWNRRRRAAALAYAEAGMAEFAQLPVTTTGAEHVYHLYVVRSAEPDRLQEALSGAGVQARGYYRTPVHRQPAMSAFAGGELPVTDAAARTLLALPMGPELADEQVESVVVAAAGARAPA
ncbi:MAG: DegT/DnrJ/EryC1/StrS family aminotransferase [Thermoleophilaceae bacterium]|nr:DegT/DnrJ/EryC1/StrS family aminotransferase [Thermoleophilaceae bacterium]